ncbi:EAL domain, c-di-GMP-specific phosphodiesterase class I (or its enzymatically inactive variant) [Abditibacterium utsteinense]|uniref:EAL domain, c-di-GMP-specific phosphodiesterase class I (Or its enzymatically inactive variant) n=1 Tax=Abditibacterium utsteinense TaxID=1960156 RepID=A0A2S8SXM9_9BACT|nr:EAL domain-containing protein [Abditibacterium utsteinense]PQV65518.1 EAL domain, c-di-GMP-specific phosphodiesterase class I (or its enzymatically inactive variant) [Abditibacterium utsteinense]
MKMPRETPNPNRSEAISAPIAGPGTLYLRFSERYSAQLRLENALRAAPFHFLWEDDVLTIAAPETDVSQLVELLRQTLFSGEQAAIKTIWERQGEPLSLRDCFNVESLRSFLARAQSGWFLKMMREKSFETHFQPIISVGEPERVLAYEGLLRGKVAGKIVAPTLLFDVARGLNLSAQLDDAARFCAIESAAKHGLKAKIFLNISPATLGDGRETLYSTVEATEKAGLLREQIVFEIIESECIEDVAQLQSALNGLRKSGFRVALDDLGAGYASLQLLGQLRPDYVKLDRELVAGVECDPFKALIAQKILETARALGITTVAEGVESRAQWQWLRDHGGDFAQGFYFARPSSPPPVVSNRGSFYLAHPAFAA